MKFLKKHSVLILTITLGFASVSFGKDFKSSIRGLQGELESIFQVVGVISFMIAGAMFYFSKQKGFEQLTSVIIGSVVFGSASSIFLLLMRVFQ